MIVEKNAITHVNLIVDFVLEIVIVLGVVVDLLLVRPHVEKKK